MDCLKCDKRDSCTELCVEAELYVSQDYVSCREIIPTKPIISSAPWPNITLSRESQIFLLYFLDRRKQWEIGEILGISQSAMIKSIGSFLINLLSASAALIEDLKFL